MAIKLVKSYGPVLARACPEIAQDYENGMSFSELSLAYSVANAFDVTPQIARNIVGCALSLLLTGEQRQLIRCETDHRKRRGGGKAGGVTSYENGVGIHAMSRTETCRAAIQGLLALGKIPYITERVEPETGLDEKAYAFHLARQPDYRHTRGPMKDRPNLVGIAARLNEVFHGGQEVRSRNAIKCLFFGERKKGRGRV